MQYFVFLIRLFIFAHDNQNLSVMKLKLYILFLAAILANGLQLNASNGQSPTDAMDETWQKFRQIHPYGYQTVALKHVDGECVFIISEPSESVTEGALEALFRRYGGSMTVKHQPLGYDGWLADAVGRVNFPNGEVPDNFTQDLFNLLYGTDYKAFYTDLDNPSEHVYFSEYRLNYSISAAELYKWFVTDKEEFNTPSGITKTVKELLTTKSNVTNELFYSKNRGFVTWIVSPDKINESDKYFKTNARRFALDTDLIIGAIGKKGGKMAIIARERVVPVTVLPPLRIETITLLATTDNDELAQSFEMYDVFAGKTSENIDMAPIYLSDELKHTEYGNLLNMTDQMLKSWTENNDVHDYNYNYPTPIDWAFNEGVFRDLNMGHSLTYNWNTAGAGYVIKDWNGLDIYAVNRTGCLPVSFIPEGMEGKTDKRVNDAEELAFDFFSELNSPELVREVQYATLYQIFRYFDIPPQQELKTIEQWRNNIGFSISQSSFHLSDFQKNTDSKSVLNSPFNRHLLDSLSKSKKTIDLDDPFLSDVLETSHPKASSSTTDPKALFNSLYNCVEDLLRFSMYLDTPEHHDSCKSEGYIRFMERYDKNSAQDYITNLIKNDPYGGFGTYLYEKLVSIDDIDGFNKPDEFWIKQEYDYYLSSSIDSICNYIGRYQSCYGAFPYKEASKYIVDRNAWEKEIRRLNESNDLHYKEYNAVVDEFNANVKKHNAQNTYFNFGNPLLELERTEVQRILKYLDSEIEKNSKEILRLYALMPNTNQKKALGTLNWLLTDPIPYDEPIGPFYADKCTSHKQWAKSSPVTCSSFHRSGGYYGGHNLSAHVSPISLASKAPKSGKAIKEGYCFVSLEKGQKVITVANVDKAKITPKVLRIIERETVVTEKGEMFKLPKAPKERPKIAIIEKGNTNETRGFDKIKHSTNVSSKEVFVEGKEVKTSAELREAVANGSVDNGTNAVKTICFKDYSARKVHVQSTELGECIIERSPRESLNLNNFSDDIKVISQNDGTLKLTLEQFPETLPDNGKWKSGTLEITIPNQNATSAKEALKKVRALPKQNIDNTFKWKQKLNLELQEFDPGFNINDIKCEFNLTGYIFHEFENEILYENAA